MVADSVNLNQQNKNSSTQMVNTKRKNSSDFNSGDLAKRLVREKVQSRQKLEISKPLLFEVWKRYAKKISSADISQIKKTGNKFQHIIGKRIYTKVLTEFKKQRTSLGFSKPKVNKMSSKKVDSNLHLSSSKSVDQYVKEHGIHKIATNFLDKFCIFSKGDQQTLNLDLILNSLPKKITKQNLAMVDMFDFGTVQKSIIQFQNNTMEDLFIVYDKRSKKRYNFIQQMTDDQQEEVQQLVEDFREIKRRFVRAAKYSKKVDFNIKKITEDVESSSSSLIDSSDFE